MKLTIREKAVDVLICALDNYVTEMKGSVTKGESDLRLYRFMTRPQAPKSERWKKTRGYEKSLQARIADWQETADLAFKMAREVEKISNKGVEQEWFAAIAPLLQLDQSLKNF